MSSHGGVKKGLFNNSATGQGLEGLYSNEAQGIQSQLVPTLESQMINPQGYTPTEKAQQTTVAEQSAGGGNAAATGGALLRAIRTRNAGAAAPAIASAGRNAGEELSQRTAEMGVRDADLKRREQAQAESGLGSLYSTDTGAGLNALGLSNQSLNDAGNLKNFWENLLLSGMQDASTVAAAYEGKK